MLDSKLLRKDLETVVQNLARRGFIFDVNKWNDLESKRKDLQVLTEDQQGKLNQLSKEIGIAKKNSEDTNTLQQEASELSNLITERNAILSKLLEEIDTFILSIPNTIDVDIPDGKDESDNLELRKVGDPREFSFIPKDHLELGKNQEIDMESGAKITGSRFTVLKNEIALLQRALINFMIDTHVSEHGYEEVYVPYIVNKDSLLGTGQLPKFEEDLFLSLIHISEPTRPY